MQLLRALQRRRRRRRRRKRKKRSGLKPHGCALRRVRAGTG
jgi:hypothetical protein